MKYLNEVGNSTKGASEFLAPKVGNTYAGLTLKSDKVTIFSASYWPYATRVKEFYKSIGANA